MTPYGASMPQWVNGENFLSTQLTLYNEITNPAPLCVETTWRVFLRTEEPPRRILWDFIILWRLILVNITVTSFWRRWRLKSPASRLFAPPIVRSCVNQRKHQSSASLAFVRGIHRWPLNSPYKGSVTRKMFPFDDAIMINIWCILSVSFLYDVLKFVQLFYMGLFVALNVAIFSWDCVISEKMSGDSLTRRYINLCRDLTRWRLVAIESRNDTRFGEISPTILQTCHLIKYSEPIISNSRIYFETWRRHQMETFSALSALCEGNPPDIGGFPLQRPVMRSCDVFFDLFLKMLSKRQRRRWFETPSRTLWHHGNVTGPGARASAAIALLHSRPAHIRDWHLQGRLTHSGLEIPYGVGDLGTH